MVSFIAHISDPIRAELERLQFLFLLRLKDSFTELKEAMMEFLSLMSPSEGDKISEEEEVLSPTTPRHPLLGARHDTLVAGDDFAAGSEGGEGEGERMNTEWESVEISDFKPVLSQTETASGPAELVSGPDEPVSRENSSSATIAGCVLVRSIQADILLPTIFNEKTNSGGLGESDKNTPINSPLLSPSHPPAPPEQHSPSEIRVTLPRNLPPPSPLSHTLTHSQHETIEVQQSSRSASQSSLLSQTSQTSQTSFQQQISESHVSVTVTRETGLSGSQTSLPILFEPRGQSPRDGIGLGAVASSNGGSGGPHRSMSASNIASKTTPTLSPSPTPQTRQTSSSGDDETEGGYVMVQVEQRGVHLLDSR